MKSSEKELESIIIQNLQSICSLKNEIEIKGMELHDQIKKNAEEVIRIIDSFELIEDDFKAKGLDKDDIIIKAINRYKTIKKKLLNLLQKSGITKIEFSENRMIVGLCEVVETIADNSKQNDEIVSVVRSGYIRGNELIRPAQVIIVKN